MEANKCTVRLLREETSKSKAPHFPVSDENLMVVYLSYYVLPRISVKNPSHGVERSQSERLGTACHQFDNVWVHTQPSPFRAVDLGQVT